MFFWLLFLIFFSNPKFDSILIYSDLTRSTRSNYKIDKCVGWVVIAHLMKKSLVHAFLFFVDKREKHAHVFLVDQIQCCGNMQTSFRWLLFMWIYYKLKTRLDPKKKNENKMHMGKDMYCRKVANCIAANWWDMVVLCGISLSS